MRAFFILLFTFVSVGVYSQDSATEDAGVVIDGVRWATRNVAMPGTFAATPEEAGMFFQWSRMRGWSSTGEYVDGWDASIPEGSEWELMNDPCPPGWRVPTFNELFALMQVESVWYSLNGVGGRLFGTAPNQIFLPAAGWRARQDSGLGGVGADGAYWGNSENGNLHARDLGFGPDGVGAAWGWRAGGQSVRCVWNEVEILY